MNKIKFISNDKIYFGDISIVKDNVIKLYIADMPEYSYSGFYLLNEHNNEIMGDYSLYNVKYKDSNEIDTVYVSTGEVYAEPIPSEPSEEEKKVLAEEKLESVKISKINELSIACAKIIEEGIEYNCKKYSYTVQDQSNMLNAMNLAKKTGMEIPYHADGESCSLYNYDTLASIYMMEQMNITTNQTYFNQMKLYVLSITDTNDIDKVNKIKYGDELTGEYVVKYNEIIEQSNKVMQKLISLNTDRGKETV